VKEGKDAAGHMHLQCRTDKQGEKKEQMSDINIIREDLFAATQAGDATTKDNTEQSNLPLSVRIGYGAPPEKTEVTRANYYEGYAGYGSGGYYYSSDGNPYPIGYSGSTISFDLSSFH
jgi:hypothetical protein